VALSVKRHPSPSTNRSPKTWARETTAYRRTFDPVQLFAKTWRDLILVALSTGEEHVALEAIEHVKGREQILSFRSFTRGEDEDGELPMEVLNEKAESVKDDATDATSLLFTSTGKLNDQSNYYDD